MLQSFGNLSDFYDFCIFLEKHIKCLIINHKIKLKSHIDSDFESYGFLVLILETNLVVHIEVMILICESFVNYDSFQGIWDPFYDNFVF